MKAYYTMLRMVGFNNEKVYKLLQTKTPIELDFIIENELLNNEAQIKADKIIGGLIIKGLNIRQIKYRLLRQVVQLDSYKALEYKDYSIENIVKEFRGYFIHL